MWTWSRRTRYRNGPVSATTIIWNRRSSKRRSAPGIKHVLQYVQIMLIFLNTVSAALELPALEKAIDFITGFKPQHGANLLLTQRAITVTLGHERLKSLPAGILVLCEVIR